MLSRTRGTRSLNEIDLVTNDQQTAVGANKTASTMAESSTGLLAVGLATRKTGAVQLLATNGLVADTVPVSAPVLDLAFGDDGVTLYALCSNGQATTVTVINTVTHKVTQTVGLPSDARSLVPTPSQTAVWTVEASGTVQETSLVTQKPISSFNLRDPGIAITISPSGRVVYVLKGTHAAANVAAIETETERTQHVFPAASNSVGLAISPDGDHLYDFVGSATYGNIQVIDV